MKTSDSLHPLLLLLSFLTPHNLIFVSRVNIDAFSLSVCLTSCFTHLNTGYQEWQILIRRPGLVEWYNATLCIVLLDLTSRSWITSGNYLSFVLLWNFCHIAIKHPLSYRKPFMFHSISFLCFFTLLNFALWYNALSNTTLCGGRLGYAGFLSSPHNCLSLPFTTKPWWLQHKMDIQNETLFFININNINEALLFMDVSH
jgi:hypothetical protein